MGEVAKNQWAVEHYPQLMGADLRLSAQNKIQGIYEVINDLPDVLKGSQLSIQRTSEHIQSLFLYTDVIEKMSGINDNIRNAKVILQRKERTMKDFEEKADSAVAHYESIQDHLRIIGEYIENLASDTYDESTIAALESRLEDLSKIQRELQDLEKVADLQYDNNDEELFDVETFVKAQGELFALNSENPLDALAQIRIGLVERRMSELEDRLTHLEKNTVTRDGLEERLKLFKKEIFNLMDEELMKKREFSGFEGTQSIRNFQSSITTAAQILQKDLQKNTRGFELISRLFPHQHPDTFRDCVDCSVILHPFVTDYQKEMKEDGSFEIDEQTLQQQRIFSHLQEKNTEEFGEFHFENFPFEANGKAYNLVTIPLCLGETVIATIQIKVEEDLAALEPNQVGLEEIIAILQRSFESHFIKKKQDIAAFSEYAEQVEKILSLTEQKQQHKAFVESENPVITLIANTPENLKGRQAETVEEDSEHFKKGVKTFTSGTAKEHARIRAEKSQDKATQKNYEDMRALIQLYEDFLLDSEYRTNSQLSKYLLDGIEENKRGYLTIEAIDDAVDQLQDIISSAQQENIPDSLLALRQINISASFSEIRAELKDRLREQRQKEILTSYAVSLSKQIVSSAKDTENFINTHLDGKNLSEEKQDALSLAQEILPIFSLLQHKLNGYLEDDFSGFISKEVEVSGRTLVRIMNRIQEFLIKQDYSKAVCDIFKRMQEAAKNSLHSSFEINKQVITDTWYKILKKYARAYTVCPTKDYIFSNICCLEDVELYIHGHGPNDGDDVFGEFADDFALLAKEPQSKEEEELQLKSFIRIQDYFRENFDASNPLEKITMETRIMLLYFFMDPNVPHFMSKVVPAFEKLSSKTLLIQNKASHEVFRANTREDLLDIECIDRAEVPILFFDSIEQYYQFIQDPEAQEILESSFDKQRLPNKKAAKKYKIFIRNHGALADYISRNTGKVPMIIDLSGKNYFGEIRSRSNRHMRGELNMKEEAACIQDPKRLYYLWRIHRAIGENDSIAYGGWSMLTARYEHEKRLRAAIQLP